MPCGSACAGSSANDLRCAVPGHHAGLVVLAILEWEHAGVGSAGIETWTRTNQERCPARTHQADASPFRPPPRRPWLQRIVPVAEHLAGYRGRTLGRDALAGVTVAALALPAGDGVRASSPDCHRSTGCTRYCCPRLPTRCFGSARMLIVGPEGAIAAMVGAALIPMTPDPGERASLAALLAMLVGAAYLAALLARLGWIADYLSLPVLIGYIHGVAFVMIVSQLAKLVVWTSARRAPPGQVVEVVQEISQLNPADRCWWAGCCLVVLLLARWLVPKLPAALIVVVVAIAASARPRPGAVRRRRRGRHPGRPAQHSAARPPAASNSRYPARRTGHLRRQLLR